MNYNLELIEDSDSDYELYEAVDDVDLNDEEQTNEMFQEDLDDFFEDPEVENYYVKKKKRKRNRLKNDIYDEFNKLRENKEAIEFVQFCFVNDLISEDDSRNVFAHLSDLFSLISNNHRWISKSKFINFFKRKEFTGDIKEIFRLISSDKKRIKWSEFFNFFGVFL